MSNEFFIFFSYFNHLREIIIIKFLLKFKSPHLNIIEFVVKSSER